MALMRGDDGDRRRFEWTRDCFVGRGRIDGLSFDESHESHRRVSQLHAALTWNPRIDRWEVRDLGSANGTLVDGEALAPGSAAALDVATRLTFGGPVFTVLDVSPPPARALCGPLGEARVASDGVLLLPDDSAPDVSLVECARGWVQCAGEADPEAVPPDAPLVSSGDVIVAGGRRWTIRLPLSTHQTNVAAGRLSDRVCVFELANAGDEIRLSLEGSGATIELPPRKHHELLWLLARARLADREAGLAVVDRGWRTPDELIGQLALKNRDPFAYLNLLVYRARQQLAEAGVSEHRQIIERRRSDQRLRIGVSSLRIIEPWQEESSA